MGCWRGEDKKGDSQTEAAETPERVDTVEKPGNILSLKDPQKTDLVHGEFQVIA